MNHTTMNLIKCPVGCDEKGRWSYPRYRMSMDFRKIVDEYDAWSPKGNYVSWKSIHKLPYEHREYILKQFPGWDTVVVTGDQYDEDNNYLIVFDVDDIDLVESFRESCFETYGSTYTRTSQSGKLHIYYYLMIREPVLNKKTTVYFNSYVKIDGKPLNIELKQGSLVKFSGEGRMVRDDLPIRTIMGQIDNPMDTTSFAEIFQRLGDTLKVDPGLLKQSSNGTYEYDGTRMSIPQSVLDQVCQDYIYPRWVDPNYEEGRDKVIRAINGGMKRNGFTDDDILYIIQWINENAEPDCKWGQCYRNPEIIDKSPSKMLGCPTLKREGFNELCDWILLGAEEAGYSKELRESMRQKREKIRMLQNKHKSVKWRLV